MPVIDAHQHFWNLDAPWHGWPGPDLLAIHRDFGPGDLSPSLARHGVAGTMLVQSQPDDADTEWMLDVAAATPAVLGVVGWIDLLAPDAPARVAALARRPKLKGLRPMLQDLAPDWVLQPAAAPALAAIAAHGLVFDALVRPAHLAAVEALGRRHPDLAIVVDHAAKPDIAGGALQPWADDLERLAANPRIACKLSGLVTEAAAGWTVDDLAPYVRRVLTAFGPDRTMWGSDWPVLLLNASYDAWWRAAHDLVAIDGQAAVFGGTAARIYGLDVEESRAIPAS